MIHPKTMIQWIDVNDGVTGPTSIERLFQEYSHISTCEKESNRRRDMFLIRPKEHHGNSSLKIQDMYGYTDVLAILKLECHVPWREITTPSKRVVVSEQHLIPLYDISKETIGFHGERKYDYILCHPDKFKEGYYLQVRNGIDENDKETDFVTANVAHLFDSAFGYEIYTKSKFFTADDIRVYGSDEIDMEIVSRWEK